MSIKQLEQIAEENNIKATIKQLGGMILANVNGFSFRVTSPEQFLEKAIEKMNSVKPERIDLTNKLEKIERQTLEQFK